MPRTGWHHVNASLHWLLLMVLLLQQEQLNFLEQVAKSFLVLLSLHAQRLHCLVQVGHLALQLLDLGCLCLARCTTERRLICKHLAVEYSGSLRSDPHEMAFSCQRPPGKHASDPGLNRSYRPPQLHQSLQPLPHNDSSEEGLDPYTGHFLSLLSRLFHRSRAPVALLVGGGEGALACSVAAYHPVARHVNLPHVFR